MRPDPACLFAQVWDLRKEAVSLTLRGHSDTVTGMRLSPDGNHLLTNSMDNTLRVWDVRPFALANRCTKVFTGERGSGPWSLVPGPWSLDPGPWTLVPGPWSLVPGPWSLVPGPWALGPGPWALDPNPKPKL